jgi:hypothetical protein
MNYNRPASRRSQQAAAAAGSQGVVYSLAAVINDCGEIEDHKRFAFATKEAALESAWTLFKNHDINDYKGYKTM